MIATEQKTCPFCAETIKSAAIRCRWCGSDLTDAPEPQPQPGAERDPEPQEPSEETPRRAGRLGRLAGSRWTALALGVLAVLLAVVLGRLLLVDDDAPVATGNDPGAPGAVFESEGAKSAGLSAAARATERVLSYSHATLEDDMAAAARELGPAMRREYDETMAAIADETRRNKAEVEATVVAASAISATEHDVRALLFVNQTTTGKHLQQPRADLNRVVVSLHRDGGDWVVTDLDAL